VELEVVNRYLRKVDRYGDKVITQLIELIDPSIYLGNAASITMVLVACLQRSGKLECRSLGRAESAVLIGLDGVLFLLGELLQFLLSIVVPCNPCKVNDL
jgi:hypothetical protein